MKFTPACSITSSRMPRRFTALAGRAAALVLFLMLPTVGAQTIDPTFQPQPDDDIWTVAAHPDGDLLVGGYFHAIDNLDIGGFTRLDSAGHVEPNFAYQVFHSTAWTVSVQADDRLVIGGDISQIDSYPRHGVARLLADGSMDTSFAGPEINGRVFATAVQADGKILVGGGFSGISGYPGYAKLTRLKEDGSLDAGFNPQVDDDVDTMVLQPDGKILIGGYFRNIGGVEQKYLARLNADGSLDTSFRPDLDSYVWAIALQADGKILIGGQFSSIGPTAYHALARLNANGSLDSSFADPQITTGAVYAIAPQTDGKLLVSGSFTSVNGTPRGYVARINANGSLDPGFGDLDADWMVVGLSLQPDGRLLLGGRFAQIGGLPIAHLARTMPIGAASQSMTVGGTGSSVAWLRSGASPELMAPPAVYRSTDSGVHWTRLGTMQRIAGGWQLNGITPLLGQPFLLRVDGQVQSGNGSNSQGRVRVQDEYFFDDRIFANGFDPH